LEQIEPVVGNGAVDENGVCNVSGSMINEATIHEMQWYRIDQVSTRRVDGGYIIQELLVVRLHCHLQEGPSALSKWLKFKKTMLHCA
jgi:hypothetical protein